MPLQTLIGKDDELRRFEEWRRVNETWGIVVVTGKAGTGRKTLAKAIGDKLSSILVTPKELDPKDRISEAQRVAGG